MKHALRTSVHVFVVLAICAMAPVALASNVSVVKLSCSAGRLLGDIHGVDILNMHSIRFTSSRVDLPRAQ